MSENTQNIPHVASDSYYIDLGYVDIFTTFQKHIETSVKIYKLSSIYNFQLLTFTGAELSRFFQSIFDQQVYTFKINISFGFILYNQETEETAYYTSSRNNQLLVSSRVIRNNDDKLSLCQEIENVDLQQHVSYPNTKWRFVKATNVTFYITKLDGVAIGAVENFPGHLLNNKGLISLVTSNQTGVQYSDSKCFFRCLSLHRGCKVSALENETNKLCKEYCERSSIELEKFNGVSIDQLEDISKIFDVGFNVYIQDNNRNTELIYRSIRQDNILYLNLYNKHFSYINDFNKYSRSYCCSKCRKIFNHHGNFKRHMLSCDASTKELYTNGVFRLPETIFEQLERQGINIPSQLRFYEHMVTFDVECTLSRDIDISNTDKVNYSFKHELASISICSNVKDYTKPVCIISDGCPRKLVKKFIEYLTKVAKNVAELQYKKFSEFIPKINALDNQKIQEKFEEYMTQTPILSFNGSRYDLKIIREYLIPTLVELENIRYVIKRGSIYTCISTQYFKFLDITSYLAAGVNYDSFLKAYGAVVHKSYFPYEYFSSLEQLYETTFPNYDCFYSTLKGKNTLEPCKLDNLTEDEANLIGRMPTKEKLLSDTEVKLISSDRYNKLREMFYSNGWSFRDYLEFYNNLDTKPFLDAAKNLSQYYIQRGIDIFKESVSGKTLIYFYLILTIF